MNTGPEAAPPEGIPADRGPSARTVTIAYTATVFVIVAIFVAIDWYRTGAMSSGNLFGWLVFGMGVVVLIVPGRWLAIGATSTRQFRENYPHLAWIGWVFPVLQLLCFASLLWLLLTPYTPLDMAHYWEQDGGRRLLGGTLAAGLAALTGLFASLTGVFPELLEGSGYRYTCGDQARSVGRTQLVLALGTMVAALTILVF